MIKALAATSVIGGGIGAGITALATRDSSSGDGAFGVAKGLGVGGAAAGGLGLGMLAYAARAGGPMSDTILRELFVGLPAMGITAIGAGLVGAAIGTALIGTTKD